MNMEAVFAHFPVLESENLVLSNIEEEHAQDVFSIYDHDKVFEYCGIIPKHNIKTVEKMISHFDRDYNKIKQNQVGNFPEESREYIDGNH